MGTHCLQTPPPKVTSFKYPRRVIVVEDNNWPAVVHNLRRVRHKWTLLTQVLSREGADAQTLGNIYLAVVKSILIYGSDTWVLTPLMKRVLDRFH